MPVFHANVGRRMVGFANVIPMRFMTPPEKMKEQEIIHIQISPLLIGQKREQRFEWLIHLLAGEGHPHRLSDFIKGRRFFSFFQECAEDTRDTKVLPVYQTGGQQHGLDQISVSCDRRMVEDISRRTIYHPSRRASNWLVESRTRLHDSQSTLSIRS